MSKRWSLKPLAHARNVPEVKTDSRVRTDIEPWIWNAMDELVRTRPDRADNAIGDAADYAPISVIVPCFRCAATIHDAIASAAAQTLRPAEVLLVDDGSGDGTLDTLYRIAAEHEAGWIKVIAMPVNRGVSFARNEGW